MNLLPSSPTQAANVMVDLRQQLTLNFEDIMEKYAAYVRCIRLSLVNMKVSVRDLRAYILSLQMFKFKHEHIKLFEHMKEKLEKADHIEAIFNLLTLEWASFLDHKIFQMIIKEFDIDQSQERLKYPKYLKDYVNMHKLSEFCIINPLLENYTDASEKLVLKFDFELTNCSIGKVKECTDIIARILDLRTTALRILSIEQGCVIVTVLIPAVSVDIIFPALSPKQCDDLKYRSVLWLECNDHIFDFEKGVLASYAKSKLLGGRGVDYHDLRNKWLCLSAI